MAKEQKATKTRIDKKCWKGYRPDPNKKTKISYGSGTPTRTNNCIKIKK